MYRNIADADSGWESDVEKLGRRVQFKVRNAYMARAIVSNLNTDRMMYQRTNLQYEDNAPLAYTNYNIDISVRFGLLVHKTQYIDRFVAVGDIDLNQSFSCDDLIKLVHACSWENLKPVNALTDADCFGSVAFHGGGEYGAFHNICKSYGITTRSVRSLVLPKVHFALPGNHYSEPPCHFSQLYLRTNFMYATVDLEEILMYLREKNLGGLVTSIDFADTFAFNGKACLWDVVKETWSNPPIFSDGSCDWKNGIICEMYNLIRNVLSDWFHKRLQMRARDMLKLCMPRVGNNPVFPGSKLSINVAGIAASCIIPEKSAIFQDKSPLELWNILMSLFPVLNAYDEKVFGEILTENCGINM